MALSDTAGPPTGSGTTGEPPGAQIADSGPRVHLLLADPGPKRPTVLVYSNAEQMRGPQVGPKDTVVIVRADKAMLDQLWFMDRSGDVGSEKWLWAERRGAKITDADSEDPRLRFTLDPTDRYTSDLLGVALCDTERNVIATTSLDGLIVELYDTDGQVIVRLNRSVGDFNTAVTLAGELLKGQVFVGEQEVTDAMGELLKATQAAHLPPPVMLQFARPSGNEQWALYDNEATEALDFTSLSEIERATMATRLRILASRIEGPRSRP